MLHDSESGIQKHPSTDAHVLFAAPLFNSKWGQTLNPQPPNHHKVTQFYVVSVRDGRALRRCRRPIKSLNVLQLLPVNVRRCV